MDQTSVILSRLEDVREDYKENRAELGKVREDVTKTREEVSKIAGCIVGQEKCTEFMGELNRQLQDVKLVCQRNETGKDEIAKSHEFLVSRVDKLENDKILSDLEPRIRCLEDKEIIVDYKKGLASLGLKTITSSPVLGFITFLVGSIVVAVWSPYLGELIARFGIPIAISTLAAIVVFLFLLWKGRRKMVSAIEYGKVKGIFTV